MFVMAVALLDKARKKRGQTRLRSGIRFACVSPFFAQFCLFIHVLREYLFSYTFSGTSYPLRYLRFMSLFASSLPVNLSFFAS